MAAKIQGITVEIGGETKEFNKAVQDAGKQTRSLQSELCEVEKALKLDPTNIDLLRQRQTLLGQSVDTTRSKLQALQQAQEKMAKANAANADWEAAYGPLKASIDETQTALKKLMRQQNDVEDAFSNGKIDSQEYKSFYKDLYKLEEQSKQLTAEKKKLDAQFSDGHISDADYRKFQRELSKTEKELEGLEKESKNAERAASKFGAAMQSAGDKVADAADKVKGVSAAAAGVVGAAAAVVESTREFRTDMSKLEENARQAGVSLDTTSSAMEMLSAVSDETDSNVEAISNLLAAGVSDNQMQRAIESLAGAVVKFPDTLKLESLADSLQETLATGAATGQFSEWLDRMGVGVDGFNERLQSCRTYNERLELALAEMATSGMPDIYQAYLQNNQAISDYNQAQYGMQQAMADLGSAIQPLITEGLQALVKVISSAAQWFGSLSENTRRTIGIIAMLVAALAPVLMVISSIFKMLGNISFGVKGLGEITAMFSSGAGNAVYLTFVKWALIITAVVTAVTLLIAAINVLIGKGDDMDRSFSGMNNAMQGGVPKYASGTRNHPGGFALVGEKGAELLELPRGSRVYSNRETRQMIDGTSSTQPMEVYHINVTVDHMDDIQQLIKVAKDARRMERMGKVNA